MSFDWQPKIGSKPPGSFPPIKPTRIFYELDGPVIFSVDYSDGPFLFYKADESDDNSLFFAVPTTQPNLDSLADGKLSLRGALCESRTWVLECNPGLEILNSWYLPSDDLPQALLPAQGYGISPRHGIIKERPARVSRPFLSIHFEGKAETGRTLPLGVFVNLVNEVERSAYKLFAPVIETLAPDLSDKAIRKLLTMPVHEPAFGSLLIELEQPRINRSRTKQNVDIDDIKAEIEFFKANEEFLNRVEAIAQRAKGQNVRLQSADEDAIEALAQLLPTQGSYFDSVTIEGVGVGNKNHALTIDLEAGQKIWDVFSSDQERAATIRGKVVDTNARSGTIIVRRSTGREVTCVPVMDTVARSFASVRNGAKVQLSGSIEKRTRRDKLYASEITIQPD